MTALKAKFEREKKSRPTDWVIAPSRGGYALIYIGG